MVIEVEVEGVCLQESFEHSFLGEMNGNAPVYARIQERSAPPTCPACSVAVRSR